ncbi:UNVERIFIED_CONTAM: DNA-directed DNA polymerase [Siphonaria sp. JEL0065]|nr:DNA-directed DNA polymerase [Siphonaria sp. JEL0065]
MRIPSTTPAASSGTLQLYWDLASLDAKVRLEAAQKLGATLKDILDSAMIASTTETPVTKETLDACFPTEIVYALKRLIRGLSSSRDGARLGFTLALANLLSLLKDFPNFTVGLVLDLVESLNPLSSNTKGQEERELYFARIFGLHGVVESGLIEAAQTSTQDVLRLAQVLVSAAAAKSFLALVGYNVLVEIVKIGVEGDKEWVNGFVEAVIGGGMGTEGVWFVVATQEAMKNKKGYTFDWISILKGTWEKPSSLLHVIHKSRLANILKETTFTSPKLHPLFTAIISNVFGPHPSLSLHEFWTLIFDDAMFNSSSHDRKFIGFLVFQKCLEEAAASTSGSNVDVGVLFSKSFLRVLINSLAKGDDAVLNKAAKATVKQISTISSSSRQIGLQVVFQLLGKNGHQRFDGITRTKTVENIVSSLSEDEVDTYVTYLTDLVVSGVSDSGEESGEPKSSSTTRMWALDQLHSLLKAPKIPKSEAWIQKVLRFLCVHSLFVVDKSGEGVQQIRGGELGQEVREYCRGRFFAGLAEVNSFCLAVAPDKKIAPGVMQNGEYWAYDLMQYILQLDGTTYASNTTTSKKKAAQNPSAPIVRPANALEARTLEARNMAIKEITSYRNRVTVLQNSDTKNPQLIAQYKSFELLFLHVLLQVYTEPVDAVNILDELKSCADLVFSETPTPSTPTTTQKKRKAEQDDDEDSEDQEDHNPVDVIIDILLSFLAKPSALFRGVVENVFKVFAPVLTDSGLSLIFDILKAKSGVAGAEELFEEQEDDDDEEDDDVEEIVAADVERAEDAEGEEEEEDSDDDEEDSYGDDESEFEEAEDGIDELKNRLMAALGGVGGDVADMNPDDVEAKGNDDESNEEPLGDDEMEAFDEKLAAIFRERKKAKNQQRGKKDCRILKNTN